MQELELLIDLHRDAKRQGPGGEKETLRALELAQLPSQVPLEIADLGCGTGASTLTLAKKLNAKITALDLFPEFLEKLKSHGHSEGVSDKITILQGSMEALPFEREMFDVIWSEGAIYNIGFENGVRYLHSFLKPGGKLIVSEITWTTNERPTEIDVHWQKEYPEINTASAKIRILETHGYSPQAYFVLPKHCWLENYYNPMESRFESFLSRNNRSQQALEIVDAERSEIALYRKYCDYYSYGFYIAQKI